MRIPLWAAVTIVAAACVLRGILRGWDFRPDALDALLAAALAALVVARLLLARSIRRDGERKPD